MPDANPGLGAPAGRHVEVDQVALRLYRAGVEAQPAEVAEGASIGYSWLQP